MNTTQWLTVTECSLLQAESGFEEVSSPRLIQRFLELCLGSSESATMAPVALEEAARVLRADQVAVLEGSPTWPVQWEFARRGSRFKRENLPRSLLGEVLDRSAGAGQAPTPNSPAYLAVAFPAIEGKNLVLLASRGREEFSQDELEYAVALVHYLGQTLVRCRVWQEQAEVNQRLKALLSISEQLVEQREIVPLLEHIARQAAQLVRCERSSIFLWDQDRHELVGRPALGMPGGELRIPDDKGIVGTVVQTGQLQQVDEAQRHPLWNPAVDEATGFETRNLLCVPLTDADGKRVGAIEVINKKSGNFSTQDVETLHALGRQTVAALQNVRRLEDLLRANAAFEDQARQGCFIVGDNIKIKELRRTLDSVARTDLPVLVLGESGTGKDVVARAIHFSSPRQPRPFIPVNCAAIAETLLESELFGHEKGAFTDAHTQRAGKFETANGGTLFLDEIGDLSAGGQAKLLRVLEEKIVYRVGGTQPINVDTRIIAATNRNLAEAVRHGKFREDLFYRLSVVTLELPPLRDRQEDVLLLAEHFLHQFCRQAGRRAVKLSADAKKRLLQHHWPGNVRELRNLLERLAYLCTKDKVEASDLAFITRPVSGSAQEYSQLTLADATNAFQVNHIKKAIERAGGNMSDAAKLLGLHRPNLYRKMRLLDMDVNSD
jgi:Nif-specific regulatory protein